MFEFYYIIIPQGKNNKKKMKKKILVFLVFAGIILAGGLNANSAEALIPVGCGNANKAYEANISNFPAGDNACANGYHEYYTDNYLGLSHFYFPYFGVPANWKCIKDDNTGEPVSCSASRKYYTCPDFSIIKSEYPNAIKCGGDDENFMTSSVSTWTKRNNVNECLSNKKCQYYLPPTCCGTFNGRPYDNWPTPSETGLCNKTSFCSLYPTGSNYTFPTNPQTTTATWKCKSDYYGDPETCTATKSAIPPPAATENCDDKVKNGSETGEDCGGPCRACEISGDCSPKPEVGTIWNTIKGDGTFTRTWDATSGKYTTAVTEYNLTTKGNCTYKCDSGYEFKDGSCKSTSSSIKVPVAPVITTFVASPNPVASGGTVIFDNVVTGATACDFADNPNFSSSTPILPNVKESLDVEANNGTSVIKKTYYVRCSNGSLYSIPKATEVTISPRVDVAVPGVENKIPTVSITSSNEPVGPDYTVYGIAEINSPDKSEYIVEAGWYSSDPKVNPNATMLTRWGSTGSISGEVTYNNRMTSVTVERLFGGSCPDLYFMAKDNNGDKSDSIKSEKPENYDDSDEDSVVDPGDSTEDDPSGISDTASISAPTNFSAGCDANGLITVNWSRVADADRYALRIDTDTLPASAPPFHPLTDDNIDKSKTSYTWQGEIGKTYYYWMHAIKENGEIDLWSKTQDPVPSVVCSDGNDSIPNNSIPTIGHLEEVTCVNNKIKVKGWAFDPDEPSKGIEIHIYDGHKANVSSGTLLGSCVSNQSSVDVNTKADLLQYNLLGNHRFECKLPTIVSSGEHSISFFGIDNSGKPENNIKLGEKKVICLTEEEPTTFSTAVITSPTEDQNVATGTRITFTGTGWEKLSNNDNDYVQWHSSNACDANSLISREESYVRTFTKAGTFPIHFRVKNEGIWSNCDEFVTVNVTGDNIEDVDTTPDVVDLGLCGPAGSFDRTQPKTYDWSASGFTEELCVYGNSEPENVVLKMGRRVNWTCYDEAKKLSQKCYARRNSNGNIDTTGDNETEDESEDDDTEDTNIENEDDNDAEDVDESNSKCGTANGKFYEENETDFGTDTLCAKGIASPLEPVFPNEGKIVEWKCSESGNWVLDTFLLKKVASCAAAKKNTEITAGCGDAVGNYSEASTNFRSNNFCESGFNISSIAPIFPTTSGGSVDWVCRPSLLSTIFTDKKPVVCSATKLDDGDSLDPSPTEDTISIGTGDGLMGKYFDNSDFTAQKLTLIDPIIDFNWGYGKPNSIMGSDTFSVRWTGFVQPKYTGEWTFHATADDGVRLWVNDQLLIDKWIDQVGTEYRAKINLNAGQKYSIKMEYYENGGDTVAKLAWSHAKQREEIIPASQLYSN